MTTKRLNFHRPLANTDINQNQVPTSPKYAHRAKTERTPEAYSRRTRYPSTPLVPSDRDPSSSRSGMTTSIQTKRVSTVGLIESSMVRDDADIYDHTHGDRLERDHVAEVGHRTDKRLSVIDIEVEHSAIDGLKGKARAAATLPARGIERLAV